MAAKQLHAVAPAIMDVSIFNQPTFKYQIHKPSMFQTPRAFFAAFETSHETQRAATHPQNTRRPGQTPRMIFATFLLDNIHTNPSVGSEPSVTNAAKTFRGVWYVAVFVTQRVSTTARHAVVSERREEVSPRLISLHR